MYYAALHRKKQQLNPAICATRPRLSAQAAHVFGRRHARDGAELTGKVLLAGKAELFCDLAHGQRSAAQQELAFLDPDLCDIRPRRDTELRAEQAVQICRADVRLVGKRLQAELFPGPRGDELDKAVDDAALGFASSVSSRSLAKRGPWGTAPSVFWYGVPGGTQGPLGKGGAAERWRVAYPIGIATRYGAKPATTHTSKRNASAASRTDYAFAKGFAPPTGEMKLLP